MSRFSSLLIATAWALATTASGATTERGSCEWKSPAHDPYQGDVPDAVDHYTDIPAATRARLKARMQQHDYDDIVAIRRDTIQGKYSYEPALLDMHFGQQRRCATVTRETWQPDHEERALAYCDGEHCILVPTVCRNVSRVVRKPEALAMGGPAGSPAEPLAFDPPAAGMPAVAPPAPDEEPTPRRLQADPPAPPVTRLPPTTAEAPPAPVPLPPTPDAPPAEAPPPAPPLLPTDPADFPPVVTLPPPEIPGTVPEPEPLFPPLPTTPGVIPLPPAPAVPEPASVLLWAVGLGAGVWWQRRRRQRAAGL